jgi:PhnB protein
MSAESVNPAAVAAIRALVEDWAEAIRAKDVERVMAHHAPDSVSFDLAPPLISTGATPSGVEAWFATWRGRLGYEIRELSVTAGGDAAFCRSLNRLSGTTINGEKSEIWFRRTVCFRRMAGAWKIVHEHESVPFYMDGSYRAAVDLTP